MGFIELAAKRDVFIGVEATRSLRSLSDHFTEERHALDLWVAGHERRPIDRDGDRLWGICAQKVSKRRDAVGRPQHSDALRSPTLPDRFPKSRSHADLGPRPPIDRERLQ